jgi:predicted DNA-binding transcriptional regulator YafY
MLVGFGGAVEVLEPPEVRERLAEIGRQLSGLYG